MEGRLGKILKELNIGLQTARAMLGRNITLNSKITEGQYRILFNYIRNLSNHKESTTKPISPPTEYTQGVPDLFLSHRTPRLLPWAREFRIKQQTVARQIQRQRLWDGLRLHQIEGLPLFPIPFHAHLSLQGPETQQRQQEIPKELGSKRVTHDFCFIS